MGLAVSPIELDKLVIADADEPTMRERVRLGSTPSSSLAECTCPEWCEHDHENE